MLCIASFSVSDFRILTKPPGARFGLKNWTRDALDGKEFAVADGAIFAHWCKMFPNTESSEHLSPKLLTQNPSQGLVPSIFSIPQHPINSVVE